MVIELNVKKKNIYIKVQTPYEAIKKLLLYFPNTAYNNLKALQKITFDSVEYNKNINNFELNVKPKFGNKYLPFYNFVNKYIEFLNALGKVNLEFVKCFFGLFSF